MAQTNVDRLVALGMVPELAAEVNAQIVAAGSGGAAIGAVTPLTNNSGGTPTDTIADTPASYVEATIANTVASLAEKVNEIIEAAG